MVHVNIMWHAFQSEACYRIIFIFLVRKSKTSFPTSNIFQLNFILYIIICFNENIKITTRSRKMKIFCLFSSFSAARLIIVLLLLRYDSVHRESDFGDPTKEKYHVTHGQETGVDIFLHCKFFYSGWCNKGLVASSVNFVDHTLIVLIRPTDVELA